MGDPEPRWWGPDGWSSTPLGSLPAADLTQTVVADELGSKRKLRQTR